jgi:hypothetical protein
MLSPYLNEERILRGYIYLINTLSGDVLEEHVLSHVDCLSLLGRRSADVEHPIFWYEWFLVETHLLVSEVFEIMSKHPCRF